MRARHLPTVTNLVEKQGILQFNQPIKSMDPRRPDDPFPNPSPTVESDSETLAATEDSRMIVFDSRMMVQDSSPVARKRDLEYRIQNHANSPEQRDDEKRIRPDNELAIIAASAPLPDDDSDSTSLRYSDESMDRSSLDDDSESGHHETQVDTSATQVDSSNALTVFSANDSSNMTTTALVETIVTSRTLTTHEISSRNPSLTHESSELVSTHRLLQLQSPAIQYHERLAIENYERLALEGQYNSQDLVPESRSAGHGSAWNASSSDSRSDSLVPLTSSDLATHASVRPSDFNLTSPFGIPHMIEASPQCNEHAETSRVVSHVEHQVPTPYDINSPFGLPLIEDRMEVDEAPEYQALCLLLSLQIALWIWFQILRMVIWTLRFKNLLWISPPKSLRYCLGCTLMKRTYLHLAQEYLLPWKIRFLGKTHLIAGRLKFFLSP